MFSTFYQIFIPLLTAGILGTWFGHWWTKRRYEDVTESYDEILSRSRSAEPKNLLTKEDLDDRVASLSSSVASIPAPDFDPLHSRLSNIESSVASFSVPEPDLSPIYERMTRIDQRLAQPNGEIDKVATRLARVEESVNDVSRRVSTLQNTDLEPLQARFSQLEGSLTAFDASAPEVDLGPVHSGLAQLELAIAEIDVPQTDLSPLQEQITSLELRVADLGERIQETRGEEFEAVNSELGILSSSFASFSVPETDLDPLQQRLDHLEQRLSEPNQEYQTLYARLAGMEAAIDALDRGPVDFAPVHGRIAALENMINTLRGDVQGIPSLEPVERQLAGLHQAVLSIPQPDLSPMVSSMRSIDSRLDMAAMENRLTAIEYGLTAVHHMLRSRQDAPAPITQLEPELYARAPQPAPAQTSQSRTYVETYNARPAPPPPTQTRTYDVRTTVQAGPDPLASARRPDDEANLLVGAAFGEPDDLERISGVGPMLSDMLQDIGVYYFWQVAEWDAKDIVWVDDKLEHFKGRIDRDNWVGQAREFAAELQTANRPNAMSIGEG